MSLRDDLIPLVDSLREEVIDDLAGLRLYTVVVRVRTWSLGIGQGVSIDDDLELLPKPKVSTPSPSLIANTAGTVEEGDRFISRISATYTETQLRRGNLAATIPPAEAEFFWLIDGEPYRLIGLTKRYLEWRAHLRRMRGRP